MAQQLSFLLRRSPKNRRSAGAIGGNCVTKPHWRGKCLLVAAGRFFEQVDEPLGPRRLRSARLLLRDAAECGEPGGQGSPFRPVDRGAKATRGQCQRRALQSRNHLYGLFGSQDDRPDPAVRRNPAKSCPARNGSTSRAASRSGSPRSTCCSTTSTISSTFCGTASSRRS